MKLSKKQKRMLCGRILAVILLALAYDAILINYLVKVGIVVC